MPSGDYYEPGEPVPFSPLPPNEFVPAPLIREPLSWRQIRELEDLSRSEDLEKRLLEELETAAERGKIPPRVRTALDMEDRGKKRGPWSSATHYRTFRVAERGRHWGVYIGARDLQEVTWLALRIGLPAVQAQKVAKQLISDMLTPQFLTDRAVASMESAITLLGMHRTLWLDYYRRLDINWPEADLEIAVCVRNAVQSASDYARRFVVEYVSGLDQGSVPYDIINDRIGGLSPGQAVSQWISDVIAGRAGAPRSTGMNGLWFAEIPEMIKPDLYMLFPPKQRVKLPVSVIDV